MGTSRWIRGAARHVRRYLPRLGHAPGRAPLRLRAPSDRPVLDPFDRSGGVPDLSPVREFRRSRSAARRAADAIPSALHPLWRRRRFRRLGFLVAARVARGDRRGSGVRVLPCLEGPLSRPLLLVTLLDSRRACNLLCLNVGPLLLSLSSDRALTTP